MRADAQRSEGEEFPERIQGQWSSVCLTLKVAGLAARTGLFVLKLIGRRRQTKRRDYSCMSAGFRDQERA